MDEIKQKLLKVYYHLLVCTELGKLELGDTAKIGVAIITTKADNSMGRVSAELNGLEFLQDLGCIIDADTTFDAKRVAQRMAMRGPKSIAAMRSLGILAAAISAEIEKELNPINREQ
jgi:hypothetical protein